MTENVQQPDAASTCLHPYHHFVPDPTYGVGLGQLCVCHYLVVVLTHSTHGFARSWGVLPNVITCLP